MTLLSMYYITLFLIGTPLCQAAYDTDNGFVEGSGYMDQSKNYGYIYTYCGNVRNQLGTACCDNATTFKNLIRDTGYDVKCECFWIEQDVCKEEINWVLVVISPFVAMLSWMLVSIFCGSKNSDSPGALCKTPGVFSPCDFYRLVSRLTRGRAERSSNVAKRFSMNVKDIDTSQASTVSVQTQHQV